MKTAVDFLIDKLDTNLDINHSWRTRLYIEQANKMFEEQVTLSHINGQSEFDKGAYGEHNQKLANEYYKETFKSE